jgi:hypothetical protein
MKLPELRPDPSWNKVWLFDLPLCTTLVNLTADARKTSTIPLKYIAADIIINSDKVLGIMLSGLDGQSQNVVITAMGFPKWQRLFLDVWQNLYRK